MTGLGVSILSWLTKLAAAWRGRSPGDKVAPPSAPPAPGIDIIVPIFNAGAAVRRCLESVLRHAAGDWRFVLVDDASTDRDLVAFLESLPAKDARCHLLRNAANSGFVVSANRGLRFSAGRDALLLNSDTVATESFLERLHRAAYAGGSPAIVSPFTNAGTICSLPQFLVDRPIPEDVDDYAAMVHEISFRRYPEIPTAVGFCMYIPRAVIERIGYFNEEAFGRGYGEENDFCERAKAAGFSVRLCDDLFIAHESNASFGTETERLLAINSEKLNQLHPGYIGAIGAFIQSNPLERLQRNVSYHAARREARRSPALLMLVHMSVFDPFAGGVGEHVRDLVRMVALPRTVLLYPRNDRLVAVEVIDGNLDAPLFHEFPLSSPVGVEVPNPSELTGAFEEIVELFGVALVHIHHLLCWPRTLWQVLQARQIPFIFTAHDFHAGCPNWQHYDWENSRPCTRCGSGDVARCLRALVQMQDRHFGGEHLLSGLGRLLENELQAYVAGHRPAFEAMLGNAAAIIAPSGIIRSFLRDSYPALTSPIHLIPHALPASHEQGSQTQLSSAAPSDRRQFAFVGDIQRPWKGRGEIASVVGDERLRTLPIDWHVFGSAPDETFQRELEGRLGSAQRIHFNGRYARSELGALLRASGIQLAVLPSPFEESFSYVVSELWSAGVPIAALDRGAHRERVRETGAGIVASELDGLVSAIANLAGDAERLRALADRAAAAVIPGETEQRARYRRLYAKTCPSLFEPTPCVTRAGDQERRLFDAHLRAITSGSPGYNPSPTRDTPPDRWGPHERRRRTLRTLALDGIDFYGDLRSDIGIGDSARGILAAIRRADIPVAYHEVPLPIDKRSTPVEGPFSEDGPFAFSLIHHNAADLHRVLDFRDGEAFRERYVIGFWYWELPELPQRFARLLRYVDEIWVASRYTQEHLARISPVPVVSVPVPIVVPTTASNRADFGLPEDRMIFLYTFNPTSSVGRKNPFAVIEAFRRAGGARSSQALLVVKTHHLDSHTGSDLETPLREAVESVGGVFLACNLSRLEQNNLISHCDCYVSLHRCEGFGLSIAEAMALGKPVIATAYSANMDFMTPANSYGVAYELRPIAAEDHAFQPDYLGIYEPGQIWAEPDIDHAAQCIRRVIENPDEARKVGAVAARDIARDLNPGVIGRRISDRLRAIVRAQGE